MIHPLYWIEVSPSVFALEVYYQARVSAVCECVFLIGLNIVP